MEVNSTFFFEHAAEIRLAITLLGIVVGAGLIALGNFAFDAWKRFSSADGKPGITSARPSAVGAR
ncbi:hypothetical protein [Propionivibrio soli]|uniref:hypothetical protein n=1 Tax=Propionivibrio soli TaxID=2976531 RepID=UPI0021E8904A|nr:hypothetical protein [Propionivibrio soli]